MKTLDINELEELLEEISKRVTIANRNGMLDELLAQMGMSDLAASDYQEGSREGKIVVLGASDVDEEHLLVTAGKLGLDKRRFEFNLDYESLQKYNYRKLQYADCYRVVLVGPIPHSAKGKGNSISIISEMENHPEKYPRLVKMTNSNDLKITKSSFKNVLMELIQEKYI